MNIEFLLSSPDEMKALAAFIGGLNEAGVPFTLRKDNIAIEITVTTGY